MSRSPLRSRRRARWPRRTAPALPGVRPLTEPGSGSGKQQLQTRERAETALAEKERERATRSTACLALAKEEHQQTGISSIPPALRTRRLHWTRRRVGAALFRQISISPKQQVLAHPSVTEQLLHRERGQAFSPRRAIRIKPAWGDPPGAGDGREFFPRESGARGRSRAHTQNGTFRPNRDHPA